MSFLILFALAELIHWFFFTFWWQLLLKHIFGRMFGQGNVVGENVRRGSVRSGEYPLRNCLLIYQLNFLRRTALKSSKKSNDQILSQRTLKKAFFSK